MLGQSCMTLTQQWPMTLYLIGRHASLHGQLSLDILVDDCPKVKQLFTLYPSWKNRIPLSCWTSWSDMTQPPSCRKPRNAEPNVSLMLAHRLRRWPNSKPTSGRLNISFGLFFANRIHCSGRLHIVVLTVNRARPSWFLSSEQRSSKIRSVKRLSHIAELKASKMSESNLRVVRVIHEWFES